MASGELTKVGGGTALNTYDLDNNHKCGQFTASATANTWTTLQSVSGKGLLSKALIRADPTYTRKMKITIDGVVVLFVTGKVNGASYTGSVGLMQIADSYIVPNGSGSWSVGTEVNGGYVGFSNTAQYPLATEQTNTTAYGQGAVLSSEVLFNTSLLIEVASSNPSDVMSYNINYLL